MTNLLTTGLFSVAALVVIAGALLLVMEIRFALALKAQTLHGGAFSERLAFGDALLHRVRTHRIRFVARWLSWAPGAHIEATILRLFRNVSELEERDRWRRWHRVHLPAFIVRAAKKKPARQERVLRSIFTGLRASIDSMREAAQSKQLTLDLLWPFVETVEELAVHCSVNLRDVFAAEMTHTAASIDDEALQTVCAWVVNELLERGEDELILGCAIATHLAQNGPPTSIEALRVVRDLYKRVAEDRGHEKKEETAFFEAIKGTRVELRAGDEADRNYLLRNAPSAILESFAAAIGNREEEDVNQRGRALASHLMTDCEDLFRAADNPSSLTGARALAGLRFTFRRVAKKKGEDRLWDHEDPTVFPVFVHHFCTQVMERVTNPRVSAFLTIESMEPLRDKAPAHVAKAMAEFVGRVPRLDPGIAVCICEGVEEGKGATVTGKRENHYYFVRRGGRWLPGADAPEAAEVAFFWRWLAASQNPQRIADLAQWMNLRLELRGI